MNDLNGIMAVKLSCTKLGTSRSLDSQDREVVGEAFDGTRDGFRGSAVLLTSKQVKPVTAHLTALRKFWADFTQPYHEDGVRLANVAMLDKFGEALTKTKAELRAAEAVLDQHRDELMTDAQKRLGNKYNPGDYPPTFIGCWDAEFGYPNLLPDERLKHLNPALYEAEKNKILNQVKEAAEKTVALLATQLADLADHMVTVLTPDPETGAMKKLTRFDAFDHLMDRFGMLCASISGDNKEKLEKALGTAKQLMDGKTTAGVRKDLNAQQELKAGFAALKESLTGLVETMPERVIDLDEPEEVDF
jgi:hypothetical protein